MNHTWENRKKTPNFRPNFDPFGPNLDPKILFVVLTSTSSYTLFQAIILRNFQENSLTKLHKMPKNLLFCVDFTSASS